MAPANEKSVSILDSDGLTQDSETRYQDQLEAERATYAHLTNVHDLPPIFHYWSKRYLGPMVQELGFDGPDELFVQALMSASSGGFREFASLGAGNCDTEIRVASQLKAMGLTDFSITCFDLNQEMLERGEKASAAAGLANQIVVEQVDLNKWAPNREFAAVMANQSLHHLVELEHVFDRIAESLVADGRFVTSDIIGRNGHLRWPEARAIIEEYWDRLPQPYRFNLQLRRHEYRFEDWDCSQAGFEGIRSQDILPALIERFGFELFLAFGNLIDPFIDRSFGHHFDPSGLWDQNFIDSIHARDEAEIFAGRLKPTHMMAILRKQPYEGETRCRVHLTPENCVRDPNA